MIKEIIEKLTCKHKWEVHQRTNIYGTGMNFGEERPYKIKETLICEKCGKIKKIIL